MERTIEPKKVMAELQDEIAYVFKRWELGLT